MRKYKIGDWVVIRKDLNPNMENVADKMIRYAGMKARIIRTSGMYSGIPQYYLSFEEIHQNWSWGENMFEIVKKEVKPFPIVNFCNKYYVRS